MRTETDIANMACDYLMIDPIGNLETDQGAGRYLRRNYQESVGTVLREFSWNCATTRIPIEQITPPDGWVSDATDDQLMYALPNDYMRAIDINGRPYQEITWNIENIAVMDGNGDVVSRRRVLITNGTGWAVSDKVILRYVARINAAAMDEHLAKAVALELAMRCVNKARASTELAQRLMAEYKSTTSGDGIRKGGHQIDSRENNAKLPRKMPSTGGRARAGLL